MNGETKTRNLSLVFFLCYLSQGVSQHYGLISQPLNAFLKDFAHLDSGQVSLCLALLLLPWVVKPLYGYFMDAYGLHMRFLIGGNFLAAFAYLAVYLTFGFSSSLELIIILLTLATSGMAIATAAAIGIAATTASSRNYFSLQGLAYYLANVPILLLSGQLADNQNLPYMGLAQASIFAALPPLLVALYLCFFDKVDKTSGESLDLVQFRAELLSLLQERAFLFTALFLILWNFAPSLGVSIYFFERDQLNFSRDFIGTLASVNSLGMLIGTVFYLAISRYKNDLLSSSRQFSYWLIFSSCLITLSYLALRDQTSALIIESARGFSSAIFIYSLYGMAADVTPKKYSATVMAFFICLYNLAGEFGTVAGGFLYKHFLSLTPLLVISTLTTLSSAFLVPGIFAARKKMDLGNK